MNTNTSQLTAENFHVAVSVCYDGSCSELAYIPWVTSLDTAGKNDLVCVLVEDMGTRPAGMYIRAGNNNAFFWRVVMLYDDMSEVLSGGGNVSIVLHSTVAEEFDPDSVLFLNAARQSGTTIPPTTVDIWAAATSAIGALKPEDIPNVVTKLNPTSRPGVLQVSTANKAIGDYTPPAAGMVEVDANGVVSTVAMVELRSGGGLVLGYIKPPPA